MRLEPRGKIVLENITDMRIMKKDEESQPRLVPSDESCSTQQVEFFHAKECNCYDCRLGLSKKEKD